MAKSRSRNEPAAQKKGNRVFRYFRETQAELRKVTWPTREETIRLSLIVLVFMIAASIFLGLILDNLFQFLGGLLL